MKVIHLIFSIALISTIGCVEHPSDNSTPEEPLGLLWEHEYQILGWGGQAPPTLIGDSLVLMTGDSFITCLRVGNGAVKWKHVLFGYSPSSIANFVFNENLLFGWEREDNYSVYAVDLNNGEKIWSFDSLGNHQYSGLSPSAYYSPYGRRFYKISFDGSILDTMNSEFPFRSLTFSQNKLYGAQGWSPQNSSRSIGRIVCYDEETLETLWVHEEPGGSFAICLPIFEDGIMYIGTIWGADDKVIALNTLTGEVIWENNFNHISAIKVLLVNDILYVESAASIRAINKVTGDQIWQSNLPNIDESPALAYWDGYIYVENYGTLYILDASTGERVHSTRGPDNASVEQLTAGAGKIFIQSTNHLYALTPYNSEQDSE